MALKVSWTHGLVRLVLWLLEPRGRELWVGGPDISRVWCLRRDVKPYAISQSRSPPSLLRDAGEIIQAPLQYFHIFPAGLVAAYWKLPSDVAWSSVFRKRHQQKKRIYKTDPWCYCQLKNTCLVMKATAKKEAVAVGREGCIF